MLHESKDSDVSPPPRPHKAITFFNPTTYMTEDSVTPSTPQNNTDAGRRWKGRIDDQGIGVVLMASK